MENNNINKETAEYIEEKLFNAANRGELAKNYKEAISKWPEQKNSIDSELIENWKKIREIPEIDTTEPQPRIVVKFSFRWMKGKWAGESGSQTYTFNFNNKHRDTDFESYVTVKQSLMDDGVMIEDVEKRKTYRDFIGLCFKKKIGQVEFDFTANDQCHPYDVDELIGHFTTVGMRRI